MVVLNASPLTVKYYIYIYIYINNKNLRMYPLIILREYEILISGKII